MLVPRFTLRTGLVWLTLGVFVAMTVREALLGKPWAIGVAVALVAVALSLCLQAVAFGLSLLLSRSAGEKRR